MTATPTDLTADAAARLERYLLEVRLALGGVPGVSADEVEADIRDHVATALRPVAGPVTLAELRPVLEALGPPAGWRPAGAAGGGFDRRAALAALRHRLAGAGGVLYRGPDDWRLAYLCLACFALALPTRGVGLAAAYLLGRAAIGLARERGDALGARRWLVYPPVLAVSLPLLLAVLAWPLVIAPQVLESAVWPAETYRDVVTSVDADGTVHFHAGAAPTGSSRYDHGLTRAGLTGSGPAGRQTWHLHGRDRAANERVLAAMDALPVPRRHSGLALAAFAAAGGLLAWWLVAGVTRRAFPHATALVFYPLLRRETRGVPVALIACAVGLVAWLVATRPLLQAWDAVR